MAQNYRPYSFIEKDSNKKEGIAINILDSILKKLNSKQTAQNTEFEVYIRVFKRLETSHNIAFIGLTTTPDVVDKFKFVGPIGKHRAVVIAKKSRNIKINSIADLNKYSIGSKSHSSTSKELESRGVKRSSFQITKNEEENIRKLNANRIDLMASGYEVAFSLIKDLEYNINDYEVVYTLSETDINIAFSTDVDDAFINKLQKILDEMKISKNGLPSEYDAILLHYGMKQ